MNKRAKEIIDNLSLITHPEGGYYKEVYRSEGKVSVKGKTRNWMTDIYFLLLKNQVNRIHKVSSDEIWHFYEGAPLLLFDINNDFSSYNKIILGEQKNKFMYKYCIKANNWQAAKSVGPYTLVGCTVAPGFDFQDFNMLDKKSLDILKKKFPELSELK